MPDDSNNADLKEIHDRYMEEKANKPLPSLFLSVLPIVTPILLIFINAVNGLLLKTDTFQGMDDNWYFQTFQFLGHL